MSRKLIIRPTAQREAAEAYDWYEKRRSGLGDEFLGAVEAVLAMIQRTPERFAIVLGTARRARLRRFPYSIYYICRSELISVVAIFHAKRDPKILVNRVGRSES